MPVNQTQTGELEGTTTAQESSSSTTTNQEGENGSGFAPLKFPSDLETIDHWVNFSIFEYSRANRMQETPQASSIIGNITLPIPADLQTAYNAKYENVRMGILENLMRYGAGEIAGDEAKNIRQMENKLTQKMTGGGISSTVDKLVEIGGEAASQIANQFPGFALDSFDRSGAVSQALGITRNPHLAVIYQGVEFRQHSFSYKFNPRNEQETQTLHQIIRQFKLAQAPDFVENYQNHLFKYPDEFAITFHHPQFLFSIGPSVLTNFSVNYHGQGIPAYFQDTNAPVDIVINMAFQEVNIVTKDTITELNR